MTQQTLAGCVFCEAPLGMEPGTASTWGADERGTHLTCVACVTQVMPVPEDGDHYVCDSYGLIVDTLAEQVL